MKNNRKSFWITAALSGVLLTGLLLVFGIALPSHPGTSTEIVVPTATGTVGPAAEPGVTGEVSPVGTSPAGTMSPSAEPGPTGTTVLTEVPSPTETPGPAETPVPTVTPKPTETPNPQLETAAYCLSVGEGSSTLWCCGTTAVLIDGGDSKTSSYVVGFLKSLGIKRISLVVATHYDSDHISGLVGALSAFEVDELWGPDYEGTTKTYQSFLRMADGRGVTLTHPQTGDVWSSDGIEVRVISAEKQAEETDDSPDPGNDFSLAMCVTIDGVTFLAMGDSTAARERSLVRQGRIPACDVYLVNHHGSRYSTSAELLAAASPKIAVISTGPNDYGHPTAECIDRLIAAGADIFRTDMQETITLEIKDGAIHPNKAALTDPYEPADRDGTQRVTHPDDVTFVLNGNSMVYHKPTCGSVSGVMHANWSYFYGTAAEAEELGYRPCGSCHPDME